MQIVVMMNVVYAQCLKYALYAECHFAECRYAEGHFAECRYAECHGASKCAVIITAYFSTAISYKCKTFRKWTTDLNIFSKEIIVADIFVFERVFLR
jgi:hypothetical protein